MTRKNSAGVSTSSASAGPPPRPHSARPPRACSSRFLRSTARNWRPGVGLRARAGAGAGLGRRARGVPGKGLGQAEDALRQTS